MPNRPSFGETPSLLRRIGAPLALLAGGLAAGYAVKSKVDQQRIALHATVEGTWKRVENIEGTLAEMQEQLGAVPAEKEEPQEEETFQAGKKAEPEIKEKPKVDTEETVKDERLQWNKLSDNDQQKLIAETQEFVAISKTTVTSALLKELKGGARYLLVGEHHLRVLEEQRRSVASSLAKLKEAGLTHVGIEKDQNFQDELDNLDVDTDNPEQEVANCLKYGYGQEGLAAIVVEAKKLGLPVLCIDHTKERREFEERWAGAVSRTTPDGHTILEPLPNAYYRGLAGISYQREQKMFEYLETKLPLEGTILIYIGSSHVHKKPLWMYGDFPTPRLGSLLSKKYGDKAVVSVRDVHSRRVGFDGEHDEYSRTAPMSNVLTKKELDETVFMLPDAGPVREFESSTDYIIIGGYKGKD